MFLIYYIGMFVCMVSYVCMYICNGCTLDDWYAMMHNVLCICIYVMDIYWMTGML